MNMKPDTEEREFMEVFGYILIRCGKWKKAFPLIRALALLWPEHAPARRMLSYVYLQIGEPAKALAEANTLLSLAPDDPAGCLLKSRALWVLGREEEARAMFLRYNKGRHEQ
jgi:tetratricopeptide (TPR) repeat protein